MVDRLGDVFFFFAFFWGVDHNLGILDAFPAVTQGIVRFTAVAEYFVNDPSVTRWRGRAETAECGWITASL